MSITERAQATHAWTQVPADEVSDAIVASMALGGIDHLFFMSGSEIAFYQEATAKAHAHGRPAPRLITMTHEHAGLNAALGYAAVSGKPVATAVHVDAGTLNYGGAIHTAWRSGMPILMTAGAPPVSYPGSMRGSRDRGGHIWMQQVYDQNGIVRQYTKWDHRLEYQDNAGLMVSRALQVALSEPRGPVYMSLPREIASMRADGARFPTVQQLGITRPVAPDEDAIREIAEQLVRAHNPYVVVSGSGRNPQTVPALVELCELLSMRVVNSIMRAHHCFPKTHPLYLGSGTSLKDADAVLVLEANIPWMPGPDAPPDEAYIAVTDVDPIRGRIPTFEFPANLRMTADSLKTIEALTQAVRRLLGSAERSRIADRAARNDEFARKRREALDETALAKAKQTPIDPLFLSYTIGRTLGDDCLVLDEVLPQSQLDSYMRVDRPGGWLNDPSSSGGWASGAAFGAKLAAPDRDVVAISGDGFYMFGTANAAFWAAAHYGAPFMQIVYQNRSYSTGVTGVTSMYPESYAAKAGFEGGYFDPPIDFAAEARAWGAYGENVKDPAEVAPALRRGLEQIRKGTPAVISVWLPKILQKD